MRQLSTKFPKEILVRFGFHTSIGGKIYLAVERASSRHCEAMQIFLSSPRSWQRTEIKPGDVEEFKKRRRKAQIFPLVLHAPYLVNLGSPFENIYTKSLETLKEGMKVGQKLQADYLVFHVGSYRGTTKEKGLKRVAQALNALLDTGSSLQVLLENTSGAGFTLGSTFEELRLILDELQEDKQAGVCFDTAHAFAAGYDLTSRGALDKTLAHFDKMVRLEKLKLIHANDSKGPLGSHSDRHEHIGKGYIGLEGFRAIVNHPQLKDLPCILETPGTQARQDLRNLKVIKSLVGENE